MLSVFRTEAEAVRGKERVHTRLQQCHPQNLQKAGVLESSSFRVLCAFNRYIVSTCHLGITALSYRSSLHSVFSFCLLTKDSDGNFNLFILVCSCMCVCVVCPHVYGGQRATLYVLSQYAIKPFPETGSSMARK